MKRFLLPLIFLATTTATAAVHAADNAAAPSDPAKGKTVAAGICAACHMPDGNSVIPMNPKLAGQHADYIVKQLKDFKSGARANPIMMGMAAAVSDDDARHVAAWFASQPQKSEKERSADSIEAGKKIYRAGVAAKGIPACAGCHGPAGAGIPAQYPRIGGQFPDYTETQLKGFRLAGTDPKDTTGRANDPNKMMRMVAAKMNDHEIRVVADYIASLR